MRRCIKVYKPTWKHPLKNSISKIWKTLRNQKQTKWKHRQIKTQKNLIFKKEVMYNPNIRRRTKIQYRFSSQYIVKSAHGGIARPNDKQPVKHYTSGSTLNLVYLGTYKLRQTQNVQINRNTNRKTTKTAHWVSRKPTRLRDDVHVSFNKLGNFSISNDSDGYMNHEARLRKNKIKLVIFKCH